jgi:hypothetical protein
MSPKEIGSALGSKWASLLPTATGLIGSASPIRLKPVARGLRHEGRRTFVPWRGLVVSLAEPGITSIDDLVARVVDSVSGSVDLLGQSMGVIAIRAAHGGGTIPVTLASSRFGANTSDRLALSEREARPRSAARRSS